MCTLLFCIRRSSQELYTAKIEAANSKKEEKDVEERVAEETISTWN